MDANYAVQVTAREFHDFCHGKKAYSKKDRLIKPSGFAVFNGFEQKGGLFLQKAK